MINLKVLETVTAELDQILDDSEGQVMSGNGIPDFSAYRYSIGYAKGIVDAKEVIRRVIDALTKPEVEGK